MLAFNFERAGTLSVAISYPNIAQINIKIVTDFF